jgi:hypothetical protein
MFLSMLHERRPHPRMRWISAALLLVLASFVDLSCANLSFQRDTVTSGTFQSTGMAVTLFSFDLPKGALMIARENASDANLANMVVTETRVVPYLGPFDFLLDIIGVRWASVKGTWGAAPKAGGG